MYFLLPVKDYVACYDGCFAIYACLFGGFLTFFPFFGTRYYLQRTGGVVFLHSVVAFGCFGRFNFISGRVTFTHTGKTCSRGLKVANVAYSGDCTTQLPLTSCFVGFRGRQTYNVGVEGVSTFCVFSGAFFGSVHTSGSFVSFFAFAQE